MNQLLRRWLLRPFTRRARPYLRAFGLLQTAKCKPALVGEPGAERVLVLAPHMDDEVIGCGGAIYKHARCGAEVTVVFLTDGRLGSKALTYLSGDARRRGEVELVATRRLEAGRALAVLGVPHHEFWDAPENALTTTPELPRRLAHTLASLRPERVYLPFFLEEHPDHAAVSRLLLDATAGSHADFECCGYEVWTPLFANYLVEISDVVEVKRRALAEYKSQLADSDYLHTALGLNAYRSSALLRSGGFAEAFFCAPRQDYLALYTATGRGWREATIERTEGGNAK